MRGSGDFSIDVHSPVGIVRATTVEELAEAIAQRIYACNPDGMPDEVLSYAPGFIRWAIDEAVRAALSRYAHNRSYDGKYCKDPEDCAGCHAQADVFGTGALAAQDPTPGEERGR